MSLAYFGSMGNAQVVTSAEDGSFTLAPLPAGKFLVIATHPEYVDDWTSEVFQGDPISDPAWVELSPGQHVEGHRVELERGRTLEGHVVNLEGRPVPGALVSWHPEAGRLEVFQSPLGGHQETCDAKGHF